MDDLQNSEETSFVVDEVSNIIKESIESVIGNSSYHQTKINQWTTTIIESCLSQLAKLNKPFKYIVNCIIMQKTGAGLHTASSCYWDSTTDGSCTIRWENKVQLRRHDTGRQWGFRLAGGREIGQKLYFDRIRQRSIAEKSGMKVDDELLQIFDFVMTNSTHKKAKCEILRCGNELDIIIRRRKNDEMYKSMSVDERDCGSHMVDPNCTPNQINPGQMENHVNICINEEPMTRFGGPIYKNIKPMAYRILEEQIHESKGNRMKYKQNSQLSGETTRHLITYKRTINKPYGQN
ncbi:Dynein light chain Tctex-type [Intoshia linei]|uniref:Dynein light chain Tctex-type n=1 Tax=Intoshia linei TaxID=1819745 RepID=A0A177BCA3_9BILA|nr:Dynein light chain Tctex-type [Intoshia linei]